MDSALKNYKLQIIAESYYLSCCGLFWGGLLFYIFSLFLKPWSGWNKSQHDTFPCSCLLHSKFRHCIRRSGLQFHNLIKHSIYLYLFQCSCLKRHKDCDYFWELRCRPWKFSMKNTNVLLNWWFPCQPLLQDGECCYLAHICKCKLRVHFYTIHFYQVEVMQSGHSSPLSIFLAMKSLNMLKERKETSEQRR